MADPAGAPPSVEGRAIRWNERRPAPGSTKTDLWRGEHLFAGATWLEPGEEQALHRHAGADKVYLVVRGSGAFQVGDARFTAGEGELVPAPRDVPHGVRNAGTQALVVLTIIAPPPGRR